MLKLIRLEWKKNQIGRYARNAVIVTILLCIFIFALDFLGIANDPDTGIPDTAPGNDVISSAIELFTGMTFLVFTAVMLSAFIVSAYRNKTMNLMFSYPIRRQKILVSQMAAVWIFNFLALTAAKLAIYSCVFIGARYFRPAFVTDFDMTSPAFYLQLVLKAAVTVSVGFIALFIGLAMKSSKAAIISSFLLIILTQANIGDMTLAGNAVFPLLLILISLLFAFLSVCRAEKRDLI